MFIKIVKAIFVVCIVLQFIFIDYMLVSLRKGNMAISSDLNTVSEVMQKQVDELNLLTQEKFMDLEDHLKLSDSNVSELQNAANSQYKQSKVLNATYSKLLDEQKKKHVDTAGFDATVNNKKNTAEHLYSLKDYRKAFEIYSEIAPYITEDYSSRANRIDCLFNINRMDSSKYSEILKECETLALNGYKSKKIEDIQKFINTEIRGIQYE